MTVFVPFPLVNFFQRNHFDIDNPCVSGLNNPDAQFFFKRVLPMSLGMPTLETQEENLFEYNVNGKIFISRDIVSIGEKTEVSQEKNIIYFHSLFDLKIEWLNSCIPHYFTDGIDRFTFMKTTSGAFVYGVRNSTRKVIQIRAVPEFEIYIITGVYPNDVSNSSDMISLINHSLNRKYILPKTESFDYLCMPKIEFDYRSSDNNFFGLKGMSFVDRFGEVKTIRYSYQKIGLHAGYSGKNKPKPVNYDNNRTFVLGEPFIFVVTHPKIYSPVFAGLITKDHWVKC